METLEITPPIEDQAAPVITLEQTESRVFVSSVPVVDSGGVPRENGDKGESVDQRVVETEISVCKSGIQCSGGDVLLQVHEQESGGVNVGIAEQVRVGEVSAVDENEKDIDDGGLKEKVGFLQLNGDEFNGIRKVQVSGDDISLVVEVQGGSPCMIQQEIGSEMKNSACRSGGEVGERSNGPQRTLVGASKDEDLPEVIVEKQVEEGEGEDEDEGEEEDLNHEFSVGDLVWAKIKSHPWWPGLIYDPLDASKSAAKCRRKDCLLVAYFGDNSFAWCDPSQLKSFQENFDKMFMQSNSENFLNAVEASMDEVGRRVELEMTCACVPAENRTAQGRTLTVNAGINEGVALPEGGSGEFSATQFEPEKFLAHLRDIAEVVSITNMLEVTLLRRRLLAFNHTRGYNQLPLYNEPQGDRAPEDSSGNVITSKSNFNEQADELTENPPEADCLTNPEFGKKSTGNGPEIPEDRVLCQRKKQRTMVEIMANDMDVEPENCGGDATEGGMVGKQMSTPRKRKKSKDLEAATVGDLAEEGSGSGKNEQMSIGGKEEEKEFSGKNSDISGKEGSKTRERKKSKYLSYPYTSLSKETNCFLSWADPVNEIPKAGRAVDVQIQLTGSPPIVKCSGESPGNLNDQTPTKQKKMMLKNAKVSPDEMLSEILSAALDPFYLKENNSYRSVKGFFTTFRGSIYREGFNYEIFNNYMADPSNDNTHEIGHRTSNGECKPRRQRSKDEAMLQSPQTESEPTAGTVECQSKEIKRKDEEMLQSPQIELEHKAETVEPKRRRRRKKNEAIVENEAGKVESKRKRIRRKDEARLQNPQSKVEHAPGTANLKQNYNEKDNGENSGAALLLTFAAGVSLPSKDDLVTVFGKFGTLNELETTVLKDSCSAQVVYVRTSDAETAFNSSGKISQFGPDMVTYKLRYLSTTSNASKHGASPNQVLPTALPSLVVGDHAAANLPASDAPPLLFIRQNLEMMTSLLERSGDNLSPGTRAKLESEIKGLLKKVATMSDSSSS